MWGEHPNHPQPLVSPFKTAMEITAGHGGHLEGRQRDFRPLPGHRLWRYGEQRHLGRLLHRLGGDVWPGDRWSLDDVMGQVACELTMGESPSSCSSYNQSFLGRSSLVTVTSHSERWGKAIPSTSESEMENSGFTASVAAAMPLSILAIFF